MTGRSTFSKVDESVFSFRRPEMKDDDEVWENAAMI